jgi:C terminal of Calcineurin-like phosphoesterase
MAAAFLRPTARTSPNGFHVLSIDGSHYTTRFVPAVGKGARQLRAVVDGPRAGTFAGGSATFALDELGACELVVNVFDGGPATRVTFEVAGQGRTPVPMQHTAMMDPYVEALFARHAAQQKPWVRPVRSSHVWKAPLPRDLPPGAHCLTVRAQDEYGRPIATHLVLELSDFGTLPRA